MNDVITTRLTPEINMELDLISKTENLDRSAVVRRFLTRAVLNWRKDIALKRYKEGEYSTEQAAKFAKISLWEFFDVIKKRKIPMSYDLEELEKDLNNIK